VNYQERHVSTQLSGHYQAKEIKQVLLLALLLLPDDYPLVGSKRVALDNLIF
jgi:hypothetical protein